MILNKNAVALACLMLMLAVMVPARAEASADTGTMGIWGDLIGAVMAEVLAAGDSAARAGEAVPAAAERLQTLIYELENATRFTAQVNTWRYERAAWRQNLRRAETVTAFARAVAGYEASLQEGMLKADWPDTRPTWRTVLAGATKTSVVAEQLLLLEMHISSSAVDQGWLQRREAWRAEVLAAGAAELPVGSVAVDDQSPAITATDSWTGAGGLLLALDGATRPELTTKLWRARRAGWQAGAQGAGGAETAASLLAQLGEGYAPSALSAAWRAERRAAWQAEAAATRDRSAWVELLLELERNVLRLGKTDSWPAARPDWLARVAAFRAASAVADNAAAPGIGITQLGRLLLELEEGVLYEAQVAAWPQRRDAWREAVGGAGSVTAMAPLLRQFADGLRENYLAAGWPARRPAWRAAVAAGESAVLAARLAELAGLLRPEAVTPEWRDRQPSWAEELTGSEPADEADAGLAPATDREQLRALAGLLGELEQVTQNTARGAGWQLQRPAWLARLQAADEAAVIGELLRDYAKSLRLTVTTDAWRLRRNAWLAEVAAADTVASLAELLRELEKAMRWSATDEDWREARDGWLARVNELRAGRVTDMVAAEPSSPAEVRLLTGFMTEFEQLVLFRAQTGEWSATRSEWLAANRTATTLKEASSQLLALADSLRDSALDERWPGRRGDWRTEVQAAQSLAILAARLLDLEQAVAWSALDDGWRLRQPGWRARVRQMAAE